MNGCPLCFNGDDEEETPVSDAETQVQSLMGALAASIEQANRNRRARLEQREADGDT